MIVLKQIKTILLNEWDPIGVRGVPEAQDEYDQYANHIASMVFNRSAPEEIERFLLEIESTQMGLPENQARAKLVVKQICSLPSDWEL